MTVEVYSQGNKKVGTVDLPAAVFSARWNPDLVHQVLVAQLANRRQPLAHTKTRGEVRGGGRKPWRQKGTGHARHGSIRSPLWVGGGVTFGPRKERSFGKKVNKKMKRSALFSVLSKKFNNQEVKIIDNLTVKERKTKQAAAILKNFFPQKPSVTFILAKENKIFPWAVRNIGGTASLKATNIDLQTLLTHRYVFIEKDALPEIVSHYRLT